MTTKTAVDKFVNQKKLAVVGISRDGKKFGNTAYQELKKKGYELYLVHPKMERYDGKPCYPSLCSLPEKVGGVFICVSPEKTAKIVEEAKESGIENIWMQQKSESEEAITYCRRNGLNAVHSECILMYADPVGFPHSIHKFVWGILGKLPK